MFNWMTIVATAALAFAIALTGRTMAQQVNGTRMIDLTHGFDAETIYWPTEDGFKLIPETAGVTEQGYFYAANRFTCAEHGGTHLDAPRHFSAEGQTVDQVPLKRLVGPAVCIDISPQCATDPDYQATVEDFEGWELVQGSSLEDRIVLIRTGFSRFWPDRKTYLGTEEQGKEAVAKLHFPGLDPSAADWLVSKRHIRMVGIDTASIDHGQTQDYPTHRRLFQDNVPALENLANLAQLPTEDFAITALPMKIVGGSGAPCRVIAIIKQ
jgi:kynurenine formamidase